jgi:hypothetical protein
VADISGRKWGLVADASQEALQTPQEFLSFVREQSPDAKENGVWIVVTDPDAYGQAENKLLEDVKAVCRRQRISLFIARASELPNGWKRYDYCPFGFLYNVLMSEKKTVRLTETVKAAG